MFGTHTHLAWTLLTAALATTFVPTTAAADEPEIVSVKKIWDRAPHNAFTDLIRFQQKWFCILREADSHVRGNGKIRLLVSADGEQWKSAALLEDVGVDLRDPKLSITANGRLMAVMGGKIYESGRMVSRHSRVAFSRDGHTWTKTVRVLKEGEWLWRVGWQDGKAYGVSHRQLPAKPGGKPKPYSIRLFRSEDGIDYQLVRRLAVPGSPNETTVRVLDNGEMLALVRRGAGTRFAWIGSSPPPYKQWTWHDSKHNVGGPNFIQLPDGSLWAGGRSYPGGAKTVLARMNRTSYEPVLTLPSGGDNSYPGLAWHDGLLWMTYYSSHEGKTSIYLAKIRGISAQR